MTPYVVFGQGVGGVYAVTHQGLAQLSIGRATGWLARFVVQQDGAHHRLQVATAPRAVLVEHTGDAQDVVRAWVAGDQALNELA